MQQTVMLGRIMLRIAFLDSFQCTWQSFFSYVNKQFFKTCTLSQLTISIAFKVCAFPFNSQLILPMTKTLNGFIQLPNNNLTYFKIFMQHIYLYYFIYKTTTEYFIRKDFSFEASNLQKSC